MHNFRELKIWKESMKLAKSVLQTTKTYPKHEIYGLVSQLNRACISVPSNIAEGSARKSPKDFGHFLSIALGSCFELETQLILSLEIAYIDQETFDRYESQLHELQKMIYSFNNKINNYTKI